jgi:hypothetical protein
MAVVLWEQDVAGSNPVTPTAKPVSPALTFQPPTQGGFLLPKIDGAEKVPNYAIAQRLAVVGETCSRTAIAL